MGRKIVIGAAAAILAVGLFRGMDWPFVGPNAGNMNMYSLAARNYLKFGYLKTKFLPITDVYDRLPDNPKLYVHHPPLLPLTISVLFKVFGDSYPSARVSQAVPVLTTGLFLYLLAGKWWGRRTAGWVLAAYCLIPATTVFGRNTGLESMTIMWIVLMTWAVAEKKNGWAIIFTGLGTLTDWPAAYFAGWLALGLWFSGKRRQAVPIFLTALGIGGLFLGYVTIAAGGLGELGSGITIPAGFWWKGLGIFGVRWGIYFGVIGLIGLIGLIRLIKNEVIFALAAFAATNMLLYPGWSFGHPYWIYYFVPVISLAGGYQLSQITKKWVMTVILFAAIAAWGGVEKWKTGQIAANLGRADLAEKVNQLIPQGETLMVNPGGVIDGDIWQFHAGRRFVPLRADAAIGRSEFKYYVFSCNNCSGIGPEGYGLEGFDFRKVNAGDWKAWVFDLNKPVGLDESILAPVYEPDVRSKTENGFREWLQKITQVLQVPQI